ncbi:MAG: dihydroneopterin aldolase family protein [Candidatus Caldarchaeum sp.]|uniref:Dihydroneopterin aldolase MtpD C-terminal domain-containing protein n=1 Tax=Caldiarchaeum subterraneum TaxID=311458 RepID=A0A7C5L8Z1_CALS0
MKHVEEFVRKFFPADFTDRDRAVFEAGIALGAIVHSVAGFPVAADVKAFIEKAVEKSFMLQPYRKKVKLRIAGVPAKAGVYRYGTLTPEKLDVAVEVCYGGAVVEARMRYVKQLRYPLMYVSKAIQRKGDVSARPCKLTRGAAVHRKFSKARS